MSKLLGHGRQGIAFSEEFWDHVAAHKSLSMFWAFLPDDKYYGKEGIGWWSKVIIPSSNVFFFFIRNNALWGCLDNLYAFLKLKPDSTGPLAPEKRHQQIEILVVQYFCGVVMMPGAHG